MSNLELQASGLTEVLVGDIDAKDAYYVSLHSAHNTETRALEAMELLENHGVENYHLVVTPYVRTEHRFMTFMKRNGFQDKVTLNVPDKAGAHTDILEMFLGECAHGTLWPLAEPTRKSAKQLHPDDMPREWRYIVAQPPRDMRRQYGV